jgi:hypothetical protein
MHDEGHLTFAQIGAAIGVAGSTASRAYQGHQDSLKVAAKRAVWSAPVRPFPADHWDLTEGDIEALVTDFVGFRGEFFLTPRGVAYMTPEFQSAWVAAVLRTLVVGGRQVILSPPRHGKTELLIHVATWLICRFPNIRILWVGGNERIAQRSVRAVGRTLVNNEKLVKTFAGPGGSFKPGVKAGASWSASEFTVATRTLSDIKGSTMTALGRGGTLLSLDADIIVADDIEDHSSTSQPGARESTRDWWTSDLESRKEEHTGLFVIGSRQHVDDLVGHLIDNDEYEAITETAHDPNCELDPLDVNIHVECMLFPELRSYGYLMKQKAASAAAGGVARFSMVYLGIVSGKGLTVFTAAEVAGCRSKDYVLKKVPSPHIPHGADLATVGGVNLVAGLDPSGSGYQASFLWAYQTRPALRMWMMMTENQEGGGIAQARRTIADWHEAYRVRHWVVEENLYHGGILADEGIMALREQHSIVIEPHHTGINKWDPDLGVSTLQPLFEDQTIILPYGNLESQAASDEYQRQLVHFSNAPRNRNRTAGYKSDLVMASWFPMVVIRRAMTEFIAEMGVDYEPEFASMSGSDWNEVPWDGGADWLKTG